MKRGIVYTVITQGKNTLHTPYHNPDWDYVCFTDDEKILKNNNIWTLRLLKCPELPGRRCSKVPKILPQLYINEYEYQIYLDGSVHLIIDPELLIETLGNNDIALFRHCMRDCIYEEAAEVLKLNRDYKEDVNRAIEKYKLEGYPKNNGLVDAKVIVRKNTDKVRNFNDSWWKIFKSYSQRDQLSFNYVAWKLGMSFSTIPGDPYKPNAYVKKVKHILPGKATDGVIKKKSVIDNKKENDTIMEKIINLYNEKVTTKSDINEHLPVLRKYAEECEHITELGCRNVVSTYAFLAAKPKTLVSVDIDPCPVELADLLAKENSITFRFIKANDLDITLEKTDLLFIDTLHTYEHLSKELALHAPNVKKYIIMHDTEVFGYKDYYGDKKYGTTGKVGLQPAIKEFLEKNKSWTLHEELKNNNGLTILKKINNRGRKKKVV